MNIQEEQVAFYHELGLAISQWAQVEISLFQVAAQCVQPSDRNMLQVGFFAIENFRSKLEFADSILLAKFKTSFTKAALKSIEADWQTLYDRLKKTSAKRNKLVHRRVTIFLESQPGRRYALLPWPTNQPEKNGAMKKSKATHPLNSLCIRDINSCRFDFFAVHCSLMNFSDRMRGEKEIFPKSSEQAMHPLTIRQLNSQIRELLGPPHLPSQQ